MHKHRRGDWRGQADALRTGLADASMRECTETQEGVGAKYRIGERSTKSDPLKENKHSLGKECLLRFFCRVFFQIGIDEHADFGDAQVNLLFASGV
jgi:hypothetical protein